MKTRPVAVIGYDDAELLDIACVTSSLCLANGIGQLPMPYDIAVVTPGGRPISCPPGLILQAGQALEHLTGPLDTLVVMGGPGHERAAANPLIVAHVRRLARISRRVASVCTGASVLAAAGLLDGKRATTHWRYADMLASHYPNVKVDCDPLYVRDGSVATAAGITSALDLMLAFVEEDHGVDLARLVARMLVIYLQRPGNQAQMSIFMAAPAADHDVLRRVFDHVNTHLSGDASTTTLAAVAGVSPRHLTRLFQAHVGQTPGRYVREVRLAAAANLVATSSLSMPRIAARCGLGSAQTLRSAFTRRYGITPSHYRAVHRRSPS